MSPHLDNLRQRLEQIRDNVNDDSLTSLSSNQKLAFVMLEVRDAFTDLAALQAEVEELRKAAQVVVDNAPTTECHDFHHAKGDYHSGFDCPVQKRWMSAMDALSLFLTKEPTP